MIKKWKFNITTFEIIHSKVHLRSTMQKFSTIIVPINIVNAYHVIEGIINIISSQWSNSIAFERIFPQVFCSWFRSFYLSRCQVDDDNVCVRSPL